MKKTVLFLGLLFSLSVICAQQIPVIKVGDKSIKVKKINTEVAILGDIAFTTYDMHFYNPNRRVLEGELFFPLGEQESVTDFALDINGNLRKAVIVEKEEARVAFESTVRNRIDPALLEQVKGNNYKARIYPIPAKGYKRIRITVQQKLIPHKGAYYFELPFKFKKKLEEFSLKINVLNQKSKPLIEKGMLSEFKYNSKKGLYYTYYKGRKVKIRTPTLIKIPLNVKKEKFISSGAYFYFSKNLLKQNLSQKLANKITIFWDASLSQKNKKKATELELLNAYFKKVKNVEVTLIVFSNTLKEKLRFQIENANWIALKNKLNNIVYDGGSSFKFLKDYKDSSKTTLFFSDGLNTLDDSEILFPKRTYVINSLQSANHIVLKDKAIASGGNYINLKNLSTEEALKKIEKKYLKFLGTNISEKELELYPRKGSLVDQYFFVVGKNKSTQTKVKLYLGTESDTLQTVEIDIESNSNSKNYLKRIWGQQKLNELLKNEKENKKEIIQLSKKYQIISPFTSLLVLDRIEDYVSHEIEPPKELRAEYKRLLAEKVENEKDILARLQNKLFEDYDEFLNWYSTEHKSIVKNKIKEEEEVNSAVLRSEPENIKIENDSINTPIVRDGELLIEGMVSDESGPLPGASVIVKGTYHGTETDFDGRFSIKVKKGDTLVYSFIGVKTVEKVVVNNITNQVVLLEQDNVLEEVVVMGYGFSERNSNVSVSKVDKTLMSSVIGANVSIRGQASLQKEIGNPLYIVNGEIVKSKPNFSAAEVNEIYVLDGEAGKTIYGKKGANGIVVITTKDGVERNEEKIADFEALVEEKTELKGWDPETPYIKILRKIKNTEKAYEKYLSLRDKYKNLPSFYLDVSDFFKERNRKDYAIQVLSNVAEIELDNYELLRALAYKFEEYNLYTNAVHLYKQVLELRPEDIQSYRDLALAYEHINEYQKSIDLLYGIVNGEFLKKDKDRRFEGVETVAFIEFNRMLELYKDQLKTAHFDTRYIQNIQMDLRIVLDWNHNNTDIDLWITDPNKEKCFYKHRKTKIGGLMSNDMTEGFGPEQFILRKAKKGKYEVEIDYYGDNEQKISGPTFLKVTTFKNYGKKNEIKRVKVVRLENNGDLIDLGDILFK